MKKVTNLKQIETSAEEIFKVLEVCSSMNIDPEAEAKPKTKFQAALKGFIQHTLQPALKFYEVEVSTVNIKHAKLDEDKCIKYDKDGRMKYTPDSEIARRKDIEKLKQKTILLPVHEVREVDSIPSDIILSSYDIELLNKFLTFVP